MAVRVPRVAAEAAVALLLIGAGCFMLLDLSTKQSSTFVAKGALFSSKLEGKFQQLATAIPAAIPTPCTTATAVIPAGTITGVCNIVNGRSGCCTNNDLNAQLLPDLSNCTTRCQSYYIAFYCYYKCSGRNSATNPVCSDPLRTLFSACNTATCQVLNSGSRVDADTDYNAFLAANTITTQTTAQGCDDFTSFGRRCEETAIPTIRNVQATYGDDNAVVGATAAPFPEGRTFVGVADGSAASGISVVPINICVQVLNPRPINCETQAANLPLYPLSVNIVVEATGNGIAPYVVANAVIPSQQIVFTAASPPTVPQAFFQACLNGLNVVAINNAPYTLSISATATNTFGVNGTSGLSPNGNTLSIAVPIPTANPLPDNAPFTLTGNIDICHLGTPTTDTPTGGLDVGSNAFSVPSLGANNALTLDTITCCEGRTTSSTDQDNDGLRAECNFNAAQGQTVNVATFNANPVATTIRGADLTITTLFSAQGSVTLVGARIIIASGASFQVDSTGTPPGQVALRGASGTSLTLTPTASINIVGSTAAAVAATRAFLITLGQVEIIAQPTSTITAQTADLVIAESSRLTVVSADVTLTGDARLVQYTTDVGGINITTIATAGTPATALNTPRAATVTSDLAEAAGGVVAVSGTFRAYTPNTANLAAGTAADRKVNFNANTRISNSRGPNAPSNDPTDPDNTAVPADALIPGEPISAFQQTTAAKFAEQIVTPVNSRATLNLCGTEHGAGTFVTIPPTGTLLVQPPSGVARCLVPDSSPAASVIFDTLTVQNGGQITITNVDRAFNPIRVNTALNIANGASIVVFLAAGIDTTSFTGLNLFSFPAGSGFCGALPVVEFRNAGNRVITPTCNDATGTLSLAFSAVVATPPPQTNPSLFTSTNEYCILVRQDTTSFDRASFLNAIDNNFGSSGTTRSLVTVTSLNADSSNSNNLRITFRCYDYSSVQNAEIRCQNIVNTAANSNSGFAQQTLVSGFCGSTAVFPTGDQDESNHGLYGLFGLIAIPIILIVVIFLLVRNSRRRADNQYMQDAATFSNVASGPQPLATAVPSVQYDVAKEIYPVVTPNYPAY